MIRQPHARRLAVVVLLGAAASVTSATAAFAAWTKAGSGAGTGAAGRLSTPSASNTCTKNSTTFTIVSSWAAITGASAYKVERAVGAGSFATVQNSSAASYTATEASTSNVTYSYRVTALAGSTWVSASTTTTRAINNGGNCGAAT